MNIPFVSTGNVSLSTAHHGKSTSYLGRPKVQLASLSRKNSAMTISKNPFARPDKQKFYARRASKTDIKAILSVENKGPKPPIPPIPSARSFQGLLDNEEMEEVAHVYVVEVLSNWGNKEMLTLSAIWFLDEEKHKIEPFDIKPIPFDPLLNMSKLNEKILMKTTTDQLFTVQLPQEVEEKKFSISFAFIFTEDQKPKFVRIWNASIADDTSVRFVKIYQRKQFLYQSEIPMNYGVDISLTNFQSDEHEGSHAFNGVHEHLNVVKDVVDKFGPIPIIPTKTISFTFMCSYGDPDFFGLNGIDFYDDELKKIPLSKIDKISITGTDKYSSVQSLFREGKQSYEKNDMFFGQFATKGQLPVLTVTFSEMMILSFVVIWNYNAADIERCVKYIKITNEDLHFAGYDTNARNKKTIWRGKLKQGLGFSGNFRKTTTIIRVNDIRIPNENEYMSYMSY